MSSEEPIETPSPKSFWRGVREWIQVIVVALIVALPIRLFIAEPFIVNGASMDPTFSTGQFLIVDRVSYRFEEPQRGDVIVFEYPNNPKIYYIKRIIGLPGETVQVKQGRVFITNSQHPEEFELTEPYVEASHASTETTTETLESNQYFVMGDNRLQSSDSRVWGPLDKNFIIGRPIVRLVPLSTLSIFPGEYQE
ncbi:MAG: signal peptidase I [Candidatus Taylorbacteria bacterium RIFCSPHIGHO2_01_FULL_44_110]|nr:MAG: signal peptidase I [Candidatus Taylorbacteria bacterium RIFCSPHIGHO2_01_FULL_44_110]OHA45301.1 MAG: signal peptidase I [Candidatus Taylorbacteria bacterium RIFCSPLOWO2_12_FULL_44_9]